MEVITPEQLKKKYNIQDVSNTPEPQKQASVVITPEQLKQKYGIQDTNTTEKKPGLLKTLGGAISRPVMQPLARTGQAIGLGIAELSGNEDLKNRAYANVEKPVADPVFGTDIAGVKRLGEGAGKQIAGQALESAATLFPYGKVTTGLKAASVPVLGKAAPLVSNMTAGATGGYLADVGMNLQDGKSVGKSLTPGFGTALGAGIPIVGAGLSTVGKKAGVLSRSQDELKNIVKSNIDNVYSGVTGDADQIANLKSKAQKGLELYTKENKVINTKNPNELISSINKFGEKISTLARSATEKASKTGFTLDTTDAKNLVLNAYKNGELPGATAKRLYRQIDSLGNDPLKIHDWVQDVNTKYGKKYQRGTIDDTAVGKIADDVAENFRKQLDFIVDRKGYAEAFGNNQELKRMLVVAAKKANKNVNFGDVTSEAGLDAGIALLTGNPLYMARTMSSGLLKGVFSKLRNTSSLRSLKKASNAMSRMKTTTKLNSGEIKPADILKQSKETQMFTPKNRSIPNVENQNLSPNMYGSPKIQNTSTKIASNVIPEVSPATSKVSTKLSTPKKPSLLQTLKNDIKNNGQRGSAEVFTNKGDLTTKILKDLEGKTTVSKQYILDATNRGELKQVERDITRQILDTMEGDTINVKEFADKVKSELLPLKVKDTVIAHKEALATLKKSGYDIEQDISGDANIIDKNGDWVDYEELPTNIQKMVDAVNGVADNYYELGKPKYENVVLPDELRGNVKNYKENIYESPVKTSAGGTHFSGQTDNYFGHTRIEDMADNQTRRVIEVQSDLYQKGNLEKERIGETRLDALTGNRTTSPADLPRQKEVDKLAQYNDPTAHFRMVREEIKKASQDGKTKLQFPTGETAMKIEGLGETNRFQRLNEYGQDLRNDAELTTRNMTVGQQIIDSAEDKWIITDVLGDGKFKAVPKDKWDDMDAGVFLYSGEEKRLNELWGKNQSTLTQAEKAERDALFAKADQLKESFQFNREIPDTEQFDISGKVDTNNPIYKFYEKEVQKYLNKFGGKKVIDDKGVSWIEIPITKEQGDEAVEAFGKAQIGLVGQIAGATAVGAVGTNILSKLNNKYKDIRDNPEKYKDLKGENTKRPLIKQDSGTSPEDIATRKAEEKYGVKFPKGFLKAVRDMESSNKVDKSNYALSMGNTPTVKATLGKDYKEPTSLENVLENSANFLAIKAKHKKIDGTVVDMTTPENMVKWYVQKYVGLLPGQSRMISGEKVTYEKIYNIFEKKLKQYE